MKKYIVKANARLETVVETDKPECVSELLECVLRDDCGISVNLSNVCIQETGILPERFKQALYDKFTRGKG